MELKIAVAESRKARKWKNTSITWEALVERVSQPTRTMETVEEYKKLPKSRQADIKDKGGFVGGHLKDGCRRKGYVLCRSFLALDMDYGTKNVWEEKLSKLPYRLCVYSTHKHTQQHPRLRVLIPLKREITEAEYGAVARQAAKGIGIDLFDDTTYEPERLMYWPTVSVDGEFFCKSKEGELLDPDKYLALYDDWHDMSQWPVSSRGSKVKDHGATKAQDPLNKKGIVGAFCRTYSMTDALDKFLGDVYKPSETVPGRYDYIPGTTAAGVVIYDDKFMYSHHATDPLCGRLLNAFDAVRLHKFGGLDENQLEDTPITKLPSYKAMKELVKNDEGVRLEIADEKQKEVESDFKEEPSEKKVNWQKKLAINELGKFDDSIENIDLILENDDSLKCIAYNLFKAEVAVRGKLPWKQVGPGWSDVEFSSLNRYMSRRYGIYSPAKVRERLPAIAAERGFHPVLEYLDSLPAWDGTKRVETLLVDYLGAEDTPYTRAVMRKTLVAAISRVKTPGIKFDNVLILNGPQGIGKSTFFARLGGEWFSDSLALTDMRDKTAAEKLQGHWILEMGELVGMRKMDVTAVKSFLTSQNDKYRPSYGHVVTDHLRQCILVGTTNSETGFLRDATGNRRFWPVLVTGTASKKPWDMDDTVVKQIWAEALVYYNAGEPLYLPRELAEAAEAEQKNALEADDREGMVRKYLDTLLPPDWDSMSQFARRQFIDEDPNDFTDMEKKPGTVKRTRVSNVEIFVECFKKDKGSMTKKDSYDIATIMDRIPGWERTRNVMQTIYGLQRYYERTK